MLDTIIRGGTVIDGSGSEAAILDVGIRDGRIEAIGSIGESAAEEIDACGLVVCPGFIDVHTHFDAQAFWDPTLSPSCYHGVTTIIGGNCGFTIAPLNGDPEDAAYLMRMLARVEGMPLESLKEGVPWNWSSFGEYLDRLQGTLAINAGFLVGHSAIRRHVMGPRAVGGESSAGDIAAMQQLLRDSLAAGGLGFSSTFAPTHNDAEGNPVPSRHASEEEFDALASVVAEFPGTSVEFLPGVGAFSEEEMERMARISRIAQRPLNWNPLMPNASIPETYRHQLGASDFARARGGRVVALTLPQPMKLRVNLHTGFLFDAFAGWAKVMGMPVAERAQALRDPAVRRELDSSAQTGRQSQLGDLTRWGKWTIEESFSDRYRGWQGRTIEELAAAEGKSAFDAMIDLALSEGLRTSFAPPVIGEDDESWRLRAETWLDPRTVIGASDAGAHLDMLDTFAFSTHVLEHGVRRLGVIGIEQAIHQLTEVPAKLIGLRERGLLREGYHADIVIFDPERISSGPTHTRFDLPGGAGRLYADAIGVAHVIVNGREIVRHGSYTGVAAGTVLRSGRDTTSVAFP